MRRVRQKGRGRAVPVSERANVPGVMAAAGVSEGACSVHMGAANAPLVRAERRAYKRPVRGPCRAGLDDRPPSGARGHPREGSPHQGDTQHADPSLPAHRAGGRLTRIGGRNVLRLTHNPAMEQFS